MVNWKAIDKEIGCVYTYVHNHFDENLIGTKEFNETIQSLSSIVYVYGR